MADVNDATRAPQVKPGWYADAAAGCRRYWDGARWTGQIAPLDQQPKPERAPAGDWVGGVLLSVLLPLIGFILGIVYLTKSGPKREVGAMCIVLSMIAFGVWYTILAAAQTGYGSY